MRLFKRKEIRAEQVFDEKSIGPTLLEIILGKGRIDKSKALMIPTVSAACNLIADTISTLPIKLYQKSEGGVKELEDDTRVRLLNRDTQGTMTASEFWRALIRDYFLGKGGYAYIEKQYNTIVSLRYVEEENITILKNSDPIYIDYDINVQGNTYKPFEFFKLLRNSRDGAEGQSILKENTLPFVVAYNYLIFERKLSKSGGRRKGFLTTSGKALDKEAAEKLKEAWTQLYDDDTERAVVLTGGMDFKQANDSPKDLELNETKEMFAKEISMLFNVPSSILRGGATQTDKDNLLQFCIIPIVKAIEDAANRDLLLESEKSDMYFSIDTKNLSRGSIKDRFDAYKTAIETGVMNRNEARKKEDLPEKEGLDMFSFTLADVLYNPENHIMIIPNTGTVVDIYDPKSCTSATSKGGETCES